MVTSSGRQEYRVRHPSDDAKKSATSPLVSRSAGALRVPSSRTDAASPSRNPHVQEVVMARLTNHASAHRRHAVSAGIAVVSLVLGAHALPAQEDAPPQGRWAFGASLGVPGTGASPVAELTTVGVQMTQLTPGRVGADISIGTIPRILAEGVAVGAIRGGLTFPIDVAPGVLFLPSAGASVIGAASPGGMGGSWGVYAGGSAVIGTGRTGLRVGATAHQLGMTNRPLWLVELGFTSIPGR